MTAAPFIFLKEESMKFLIRENFFKSIPKNKEEKITLKLYGFYKAISKDENYLRALPNGFWIKKISGQNNIYEFRINNGDRIFFTVNRRENENEENILFLLYSSHDMGVKKSLRITGKSFNEYDINYENYEETNQEEVAVINLDYNNVITYEFKEDSMFKNFINDRKFSYYYLNDEQYTCLNTHGPLFIAGSAGSGKSTITLRKLLNIEENAEAYDIKNIAYFTSNKYLKENTQAQYNFFRNKNKDQISYFYTLEDFYKEYLNIDKRKIVKYKEFKEFLMYSFPNRKKLGIDTENIYSEIFGIIKGIMSEGKADNWDRDLEKNQITLEGYLELSDKYSVLDVEQRKQLYIISEKYNQWLKENEKYDMNDLAREAFQLNKTFDFLIIDEVQDLTEIEIYSLLNLVKNGSKVVLAGDIHQMVNSSYFSFERVKNLYFTKYKLKNDVNILSKNYRSCRKIVELANFFAELRGEYIGNLGLKDYKESFIIEDGDVILTNFDIKLIERAQKDVNVAIIVSDEIEKNELYDKLNNKHRIFTVEEIKGLEYKQVICYNLTSNNIQQWEKILSGNVKQDQRYRKFFNKFYVGITRAREQLIVMESNTEENPILKKIEHFITKKQNKELEEIVTTEISNKDQWYKEGEKLYALEKFEEAQYAFEQSGHPTIIKEWEIEKDIENSDYNIAIKKIEKYGLKNKLAHFRRKIIDVAIEKNQYLLAIEKNDEFQISYREKDIKENIRKKIVSNELAESDVEKLLKIFKRKKELNFVGDILMGLKRYPEALSNYEITENSKGISLARKGILEKKFNKIENFEEELVKLNEIIGLKGINSFGKDRYTPLHRSVILNSSLILFDMILELGGKTDLLAKGKSNLIHIIPTLSEISYDQKIEFIEKVLKTGVDINIKNIYNQTILSVVIQNPEPKLLKYLLNRGAEVDSKIKKELDQLLDSEMSSQNKKWRKLKIIKQIIRNFEKNKK